MDANTLSAKIIKAEILGDMEKVADLKKQLEQLNQDQSRSRTDSNQPRHNTTRDRGNYPGNSSNRHHQYHSRSKESESNKMRTDELNRINGQIIKAELMGDTERVKELKLQLESLSDQLTVSQGSQFHRHNQTKTLRTAGGSEDLNKLNAQLIKAEMLGNSGRVAELKKLLSNESETNQRALDKDEGSCDVDTSMGSGEVRPRDSNYRAGKSTENHLQRLAQKLSGDRLGLKSMFVSAKAGDVEDEAKLFIASSSKLFNLDDEYEDVVRRGAKKHRGNEDSEERPKIIPESEDSDCGYCLHKMRKHLVISSLSTVYLCVPYHEPLVEGHCFIRSRNHVRAFVEAEEDCLAEVLQIRSNLCALAAAKKKDMLFTEMYFKKGRNRHFQIECFPIKKKHMFDCKMYFKKAIMECETEWSMNKKLIEMKGKCITRSIPKGLSYFWVSFGASNDSFGHVIEEEQYFPKHFAYEVISGLLDIDRFKYTKPRSESFDEQSQRSSLFKSAWKTLTDSQQSTTDQTLGTDN